MEDATVVRAKLRITPRMLLRGHWVVAVRGRLPYYLVLLALTVVVLYAERSTPDFAWMLLIFGIGWALIVAGLAVRPWVYFRGMVKEPNFAGEADLTADEDSIRARNAQIETRYEWSSFTRMMELSDLLVLRIGKKHMMVIPKDAFETPDGLDRFRDLANRKIATPS